MHAQRNRIQVYGLPRSGTNFVEWSLVNNFKNLEYKNYYSEPEITEIPRSNVAIKHNFPSLNNSEFCIVIFKEWTLFSSSYKKWSGRDISKETYDLYLSKAKKLDPNRCLIFNHSWLCENYNLGLQMISDKFKVRLNDKIIQPMNSLDKNGANAKQKKNKFILKKS